MLKPNKEQMSDIVKNNIFLSKQKYYDEYRDRLTYWLDNASIDNNVYSTIEGSIGILDQYVEVYLTYALEQIFKETMDDQSGNLK